MADELGEKRKEEMRLVAQIAAERPAHFRLDRFKLLPQREGLILRHDWDRREIALFFVLRDLCFGQQFRHGCAPRRKRAFISRHSAWTLPRPSIRIEQRALSVSHQSGFVKKKIAIRRPYCVAPVGRVEGSSIRSTTRRNSEGRTGFSK